jgi:hypothetical protein
LARGRTYIRDMDDLNYWTDKLREAEQELDAARTRTEVNAAAKKFQQAKAALKRLAIESAKRTRRLTSRGSRSAAASS